MGLPKPAQNDSRCQRQHRHKWRPTWHILAQIVLGGNTAAPSPRALQQPHCCKQQKEEVTQGPHGLGVRGLLGFLLTPELFMAPFNCRRNHSQKSVPHKHTQNLQREQRDLNVIFDTGMERHMAAGNWSPRLQRPERPSPMNKSAHTAR